MRFKIVLITTALFVAPFAGAQSTISIQGPTTALPGNAVAFNLLSGTQQLKPDAWLQGYNPDRYTGNDYVSSSTLQMTPQPDGSVTVSAPAPGRYKILARSNGTFYQAYLLVRPQSPITPSRGMSLFTYGAVDHTYASAMISRLGATNSNATHIYAIGCMDIDSGSYAVTDGNVTAGSWCPGTPLSDTGWLVDEARRQGYPVYLSVAVYARYQGVVGELEAFTCGCGPQIGAAPSSLSLEQAQSAFDGYGVWNLQTAQFAQQHGAENLILGVNWQTYNPALTVPINAKWTALLPQIRNSYSGKIYYDGFGPCAFMFDFQEWSQVDGIHFVPAYNATSPTCKLSSVGMNDLTAEEMLPNIRYSESQAGWQQMKKIGLPILWTDLYAANVDSMSAIGSFVFPLANKVQDNQEDVDLFEASMRSALPDSGASAFFLWSASLSPSRGIDDGGLNDATAQPAMLGAVTNWFGGDPAKFAPCWVDTPGQLYQQNFEINSCPASPVRVLATATYPMAKSSQVIIDPQDSANHVLRITSSSGYSSFGIPLWADYQISSKVRIVSGSQSSGNINFRIGGQGYNAYGVWLHSNSVTLWKFVQGQPNQNLQQVSFPTGAIGQWHSVQVVASGSRITAIVDGIQLIQYTDMNSPLLGGYATLSVCCGADAGTAADFDDIEVTALSPQSSCTYQLALGGQAFPAQGGTGTISVTTAVGCFWSVSGLPAWVTLTGGSSGIGNGVVQFQVSPNAGGNLSGSFTIAGQTFTIEQQAFSIPGLSPIGSMPHLAAEENWTTMFTLVNKSTTPATARMSLFGDPSGTLSLPLAFPQQTLAPGPLLAASLDRTLSGNASQIINTAGPQTPPVQIGSAQLAATGQVDGFAVFHLIPGAQEAVVPMETRNASSYLLAFDNTGGVVLGVAVENVSAQAGSVGVVIRDDTGTQIGTGTIPMSSNGHTSFVLSTQYPVTANKRGTIEFDTPQGGQISVLGIRTTPLGSTTTLTTIPALASVGTTGGSIAHIASGNGWQTTFVLVNTGTSATQVNLNFFADLTGAPLSLPLSFPQSGSGTTTVASSVDQTLAAGATLLVQSAAPLSNPTPTIGSAQLTTSGNVGGFVIFRFNPTGQEAVVPLENRNANAYILAFDNTNGTATGVAVNAVSSQGVNVPVVIRDDTGAQIGTGTLALSSNGHSAFVLDSQFPVTANIRGTIEFDTPSGAQIGVLGIRTL